MIVPSTSRMRTGPVTLLLELSRGVMVAGSDMGCLRHQASRSPRCCLARIGCPHHASHAGGQVTCNKTVIAIPLHLKTAKLQREMLLKRSLVAAMAAVMLSGCGGRGAAVVESPTMVLAAAVKATDSLTSYTIKFAATESFPLSGKSLGLLGSSGGSSAISGTFNGNFTGDLKVVKPDRVAVDATAKLNGISIEFSAIRIGADSYSRDLLNGAWKKATT